MHRSWTFHVGKSLCLIHDTSINMSSIINVWCARMWWKWEASHFFQWQINKVTQSHRENQASKRTHMNRSATVAWKNTWIWNGLCLWSKSANLLMPLSESIHFLPRINKLLSHVLTLFCLLTDRSLLFQSIYEYQICRFHFSVQNRSYSSQTF